MLPGQPAQLRAWQPSTQTLPLPLPTPERPHVLIPMSSSRSSVLAAGRAARPRGLLVLLGRRAPKWGHSGLCGTLCPLYPVGAGFHSQPLGLRWDRQHPQPGVCVGTHRDQRWELLRTLPSSYQEGQVVFLFRSWYGALKAEPTQQQTEVMCTVQSGAGAGVHRAEQLCWRRLQMAVVAHGGGCRWKGLQKEVAAEGRRGLQPHGSIRQRKPPLCFEWKERADPQLLRLLARQINSMEHLQAAV